MRARRNPSPPSTETLGSGVGVLLVGPGVNDPALMLTDSTGAFSFPELRAGTYQVLMAAPGEPVGRDYRYSGKATGYQVTIAAGEPATQNLPFVVWRHTLNWTVELKHGERIGDALPDATVTLYADAAGANMVGGSTGTTDADGQVSVFWHPDHANDTVYAEVTSDYDVAPGIQAVMRHPLWNGLDVSNDADIVNLNVDVTVSGATVTTAHPASGAPLAGWAISVMSGDDAVEGAPAALDADGNVSLTTTVESVPASFTFAVDTAQTDDLDGGEKLRGDLGSRVHARRSLAGRPRGRRRRDRGGLHDPDPQGLRAPRT